MIHYHYATELYTCLRVFTYCSHMLNNLLQTKVVHSSRFVAHMPVPEHCCLCEQSFNIGIGKVRFCNGLKSYQIYALLSPTKT